MYFTFRCWYFSCYTTLYWVKPWFLKPKTFGKTMMRRTPHTAAKNLIKLWLKQFFQVNLNRTLAWFHLNIKDFPNGWPTSMRPWKLMMLENIMLFSKSQQNYIRFWLKILKIGLLILLSDLETGPLKIFSTHQTFSICLWKLWPISWCSGS